jgi:Secretion system C-terminal sorting domain/Reeler domain
MKSRNLLFVFGLLSLWYITTSNKSGPPAGWSGAPKEGTCGTTGTCHYQGAGSLTGVTTITGLPDKIEADKSYTFQLTCTSANAKSGGFQMTALDSDDKAIGTFTAGTTQKLLASAGRNYVTHSNSTSYANGKVTYNITWKSPAAVTNKNITFYATVLAGNGNGNNTGDNPFAGTFKAAFGSVATNDPALLASLQVFPNPATNYLNINVLSEEKATFGIVDVTGKIVLEKPLQATNSIDVSGFERGVYFINVKGENKQATKVVLFQ